MSICGQQERSLFELLLCLEIYDLELFHEISSVDAFKTLEFRKSDVSPGKTEVKQGKFVKFICPAKGYFRETYKS